MYCKRTQILVLILISIILTGSLGCARRKGVERLAVMPIENLSSDKQLDWGSRAASAAIVYDLAGVKDIYARQVDSLSAAQSMQPSRTLEGYFFERNGRTAIHATVEDFSRARTVESFDIEGESSSGFLPLVNELARRLSPGARAFGTSNEEAFRFYGEALSAKDPAEVLRALKQSTESDPSFVAAYLDQAKVLTERGNRDEARQIIQTQQGAKLDRIDWANLQYVAAAANGNAIERMKALESLTSAAPANANAFKELGEMRFAHRDFQQAEVAYRSAAQLNPDDPQVWNELGYALAWGDDFKGAQEAMARYASLAPNDPNVPDSQGEVNYFRGDFKTAASYFEQAAAKSPAELLKAAQAHLMMGDLPGADALFARHLGGPKAAQNNVALYQAAQWEFLTGRRKVALDQLGKLVPVVKGDLQALVLSQLAVWNMQLGDRKSAGDFANQAVARAQEPQVRGVAEACRFIALGGAASSGSKIVDVYTLLFAKKFQEARPLLEALYRESNPSNDGQVRTLLAWAYVETGAVDKATGLVDTYLLPLSAGDSLFAPMIFPKYLYVRGAAMKQQGKADDARASYQLYLKYAGDMPDQFGDDAKARAALGL